MVQISVDRKKIAAFCRRNGIRRLAFFGSVLREDFRPDSDVDVLVEFAPGNSVGLRFFTMERELSRLLGRNADLNTSGFLSEEILRSALAEAEDLYVAA